MAEQHKDPALSERISDEKYRKGAEFERTSKIYTRKLVPGDRPLEILDIGCGTGLNAARLAEAGHTITGVDISEEAIKRFEDAGFSGKKCNIEEGLPFEDGSFDLVYASEVIEHVADTELFLNEVFRVLRSDGRIVLSTPNSSFWVYRVFALMGKTLSDVQHPGHIRFFSKRSLRGAVEEAGFTDVTLAARHMYMIVSDEYALVPQFLKLLGGRTEMRFKTGRPYWHFSRFAPRASSLWADTLILSARKR